MSIQNGKFIAGKEDTLISVKELLKEKSEAYSLFIML